MPRVIRFEIGADNVKRAVKFYRDAFGWQIDTWGGPEDYWLCTTGPDSEPGINGAIMPREEKRATVNTIGVGSIEEASKKITRAGGKITTLAMPIPGIGYFCYCTDTEGNPFGIMQSDPNAK
jgi:predicted enzyme related to lactoylglutathione lyase